MGIFTIKNSVLSSALAAILLSGCAYKNEVASATGECGSVAECSKILAEEKSKVSSAKSALDQKDQQIKKLEAELEKAKSAKQIVKVVTKEVPAPTQTTRVSSKNELYPPNAKPGECYARVLIPAKYKTEKVKVLKKEAGEKIKIIPAQYAWENQKILVKEASEKLVPIPPVYKTVTEKILVKPATEIIKKVPAVYETVTEKILVKPGYTTWKKGKGPIEKVDAATGEIMCLVEVPPVYKTVKKRVLKTPATTKTIPVPAVYKTVTKRVVAKPASTKKVPIPAVYKTIKVKKLIKPASTVKTTIPAQYQMVTKRVKVSDAVLKWQPILCQTNINTNIVKELQRALGKHYKGPIDGIYGPLTKAAVRSYQKSKGLPTGALTLQTLKSLGVSY